MGLWDGLESAEIFDQGQYFEPGQWVVEIVRCLPKRSKKTGQDLFIAECTVITSNRSDVPRGARRSWCQGMKNRNVAMNAIKDFVVSVFDLPREDKAYLAREFDPYIVRTMDRITGVAPFQGENPLGGRMCNLTTWHKSKQEKPSEVYTVHEWDLFDYASMGLPPPPSWADVRVMAPAYGAPPGYGAPPAYGAAPPPPNAPRTPDGRFWYDGRAWQPVPAAAAPPLPPPPAYGAAPPPPGPPPGAQRSPDGRYWLNAANVWQPV